MAPQKHQYDNNPITVSCRAHQEPQNQISSEFVFFFCLEENASGHTVKTTKDVNLENEPQHSASGWCHPESVIRNNNNQPPSSSRVESVCLAPQTGDSGCYTTACFTNTRCDSAQPLADTNGSLLQPERESVKPLSEQRGEELSQIRRWGPQQDSGPNRHAQYPSVWRKRGFQHFELLLGDFCKIKKDEGEDEATGRKTGDAVR